MFARTFVQLFLLVSLVGQLSAAPIYQQHQILPREPTGLHAAHAATAALGGRAGLVAAEPYNSVEDGPSPHPASPFERAKSGLRTAAVKAKNFPGQLGTKVAAQVGRFKGHPKASPEEEFMSKDGYKKVYQSGHPEEEFMSEDGYKSEGYL